MILGDSNLIVNWMNVRWKINNQSFRKMVQRTHNILDRTDLRPMADHLDIFQQVFREWNQEAVRLTHVAREKETTWNSYVMKEGERIEAVRGYFDGGVSLACKGPIKNKVGSAYVIQIAEDIVESSGKMKWKTIVEVAKILPSDETVTKAECTAAVELTRAICYLARTRSNTFDLDEKLIQEHNESKTRKKTSWKMSWKADGRGGKRRSQDFQNLHRSLVK